MDCNPTWGSIFTASRDRDPGGWAPRASEIKWRGTMNGREVIVVSRSPGEIDPANMPSPGDSLYDPRLSDSRSFAELRVLTDVSDKELQTIHAMAVAYCLLQPVVTTRGKMETA